MNWQIAIKCRRLMCLAASCLVLNNIISQVCSPDHFFERYQGNAAVYNYKTVITPQNDIVCGGATLKINGEFPDATDGWITKLSPRGTILWSKRYSIPGFNSGGFLSIENATDSTYIVTGRFGKYKKNFNGSLQELDAASYLAHIDKFGNVLWIKRITNYINDSYLSLITRLGDHSFLISGNVINSQGVKMLLLKIDITGQVQWHKLMFADSVQTGGAAIKELRNGELLLSGLTFKPGPGYAYFTNQGYYFIKLDPSSGTVTHSTALYFHKDTIDRISSFDNVKKIIELPGDSLVLATSFSRLQSYAMDPGFKEGLLITTGLRGQFYKADSYYNTQPGCQVQDIQLLNNQYRVLLDDGYKTIYCDFDRAGEVTNQKAYGNVFSLLKGSRLLEGTPGNRILFNGRRQYALLGLMKTESDGAIACMETASQMIKEPVSSMFTTGPVQLSYINTSFPFAFEDMGRSLGWASYNFSSGTDCFASCCDNIHSDTSYKELCNALQYKLPDNSIVKETGLYYTRHITANNCDSTAYYEIIFSQKPKVDLGEDTCFGNSTTLTLATDSGYLSYNWMGAITSDHTYTIASPGTYQVSVTNQCGSSRDEIEVSKECEFPVYIPSAFTPNHDGLNDQFGFPALNKNRFLELSIYNRYGQRVFYTTEKTKKWDGTYKKVQQSSDLFVYIFRLATLDGKSFYQKGTVQLIR